jgi:hypothetical protein
MLWTWETPSPPQPPTLAGFSEGVSAAICGCPALLIPGSRDPLSAGVGLSRRLSSSESLRASKVLSASPWKPRIRCPCLASCRVPVYKEDKAPGLSFWLSIQDPLLLRVESWIEVSDPACSCSVSLDCLSQVLRVTLTCLESLYCVSFFQQSPLLKPVFINGFCMPLACPLVGANTNDCFSLQCVGSKI